MQPDPKLFFKPFLELDGSNMVSILSFDSLCIRELLDTENSSFSNIEEQFNKLEFPIFYITKIQKTNNKEKYFYQSALDYALRNN